MAEAAVKAKPDRDDRVLFGVDLRETDFEVRHIIPARSLELVRGFWNDDKQVSILLRRLRYAIDQKLGGL